MERDVAVGQALFDYLVAEFGEIVGDGAAELELALFNQHHDGDAGEVLRHGHDLEDGVRGHRLPALDVAPAGGFQSGDFSVTGDERDGAWNGLILDELL